MSKQTGNLRVKFLQEYMQATKRYAWAVQELEHQRTGLDKEEYGKLYRVVEDARIECERIRKALDFGARQE